MELAFPFLIIYSPRLCDFVTKLYGLKKPAMGFATFPNLIVFRDKAHPMHQQWLLHEKVHHHQNWETLWIAPLIGLIERTYAKYMLKKSNSEAYFYVSIEQEAYANQANPDYLDIRKPFAFTKYFRYKPVSGVDDQHNPIIA